MQTKPVHEALAPLKFLIGKWRSVAANGKYLPRVEPFIYCEEMEFSSIGQPLLNYNSTTWHAVEKFPMHLECGFLKIKPGTDEVSLLVSHNFGLNTIEEGNVSNDKIHLKSVHINRSSFNKDPAVTALERVISLQDNGQLEILVYMATTETPTLTQHLAVIYERV